MARRPEARDKYLKQQTAAAASASSASDADHPNADGNADTSSKYYTISDPSSTNAISTTATSALTDEVNNDAKKSTTLKEIVIHATSTTTPTSTTSTINTIRNSHDINAKNADDDNIHQPPSSFSSKPSPISQTNTSSTIPSISSSPTPTTATTVAAAYNNTKLDIYTYHRGRVGQEPRNPSTGELLCDMDPIDTSYGWVPSKNAVCKVTINFPLGDLNDDDDDTDDDNEEEGSEVNGELKCGSRYKNGCDEGDEERSRLDSRRRGAGGDDGIAWFIERNVRSSRSRSTAGVGGGSLVDVPASQFPIHTSITTSSASLSSTMPPTNHYPQLPRFVQVIEWDLANPHTPTPEVYATNIASEFGLTFPQTMDLMESIERQLRSFCDNQPMFYAPMAILDPYGCERPDAHFGPPEIYCGPVLSSANATGGGGGGSRPYVVRRLNSNQSTGGGGSGGGGGGSSSNSRRGGGGSSASRPPGAIKPDKRGIQVVPKDQLILPNKDGDVYVAEVLQRAKCRSMAMVMECGKNGEESLTMTKNDVCHICHNRKERGLTFHCGVHNYCDFHCAVSMKR